MLISPWVLHRDERFWDRPEQFDPDRWLDGRADALEPGTYVAFGAGARRCPARSLAELMVTIAVAAIARRWVVRPRLDEVDLGYIPFLHPRGGLPSELLERRRA
jgi:cytochrome P450